MMSGKNFDESYRRWQYFKQYDKFRKRQARRIVETEKSLEAKNTLLVEKRAQKSSLMGVNEVQKSLLNSVSYYTLNIQSKYLITLYFHD